MFTKIHNYIMRYYITINIKKHGIKELNFIVYNFYSE